MVSTLTPNVGGVPAGTALVDVELDDARWHALVAADSGALAFHEAAWAQMLADCYGFRSRGLALADGMGRLVAGLPLLETTAPLSRSRRWTSLPFTDYCPPLRADGADAAAVEALVALADRKRDDEGVARLELRSDASAGAAATVGYRHVLPLDRDVDVVRSRLHKTKKQVRAHLEKAERTGAVAIRRADRPEDVVHAFYALHASTRRRLGVPVQPRRFFELLWERLLAPGHGWALVASVQDEPIAGAIFLTSKHTVTYKFSAADRRWQRLRAAELLLWHAIRESCERGFREFDFGRTESWNKGLREFKSSWGACEEELRYTRLGEHWPAGAEKPGWSAKALGIVLRRGPVALTRASGLVLYRYAA